MRLRRRQLLSLFASTPLLGASRRAGADDPIDVLVLGAGMAGISAARELTAQGLRVVVLEARQRIGGRIHTDRSLGAAVDLGAAWIHGERGNPLTPLAREAGIDTRITDFDSRALYLEGERLPADDAAEWLQQLEEDLEALESQREELGRAASVEQGFEALLDDAGDEEERVARRALLSAEVEGEYGEDARQMGLWALDQDEAFGGDDLLLKQGYGRLIDWMAAGLDIRLGQQVQTVGHSAGGCRVQCAQREWQAQAVIVTLPLGVLAAGAVQFEPGLDQGKRRAFEQLGMSSLGKRVLRFAEPFWPERVHRLMRLDGEPGQSVEVWNLLPISGEPLLVLLSAGEHNRALERGTVEAARNDALRELQAIFGERPPAPTGFLRTTWSADPLARGSYSVVRPGGRHTACELLAEPAGERLLFAGEATDASYPGTVHGALRSGRRAAREALALF